MRQMLSAVLVLLVLGACDRTDEVTAPPTGPPSLHVVPAGEPDGDYSMYFADAAPGVTFLLEVAQTWDVDEVSAECEPNDGTHLDHSDDTALEEALGSMEPAGGSGSFAYRGRIGTLGVTAACWFNEWNGAGGYPESAWVRGVATLRRGTVPFAAALISNGWPEPTHITVLDAGRLFVDANGDGLDARDELFLVEGELHHEDGISLAR